MTAGNMRHVLLHGGSDEAFDRSASFARRLAESFGARLHVVYTVDQPLGAGAIISEMNPEQLPELHQAVEAEARERLARLIPAEDQDRLGVELVILFGPGPDELVRYTKTHSIDLAIVKASSDGSGAAEALLQNADCSVLVLR
jgi:nucleotide-binding universal stress UspA family protein